MCAGPKQCARNSRHCHAAGGGCHDCHKLSLGRGSRADGQSCQKLSCGMPRRRAREMAGAQGCQKLSWAVIARRTEGPTKQSRAESPLWIASARKCAPRNDGESVKAVKSCHGARLPHRSPTCRAGVRRAQAEVRRRVKAVKSCHWGGGCTAVLSKLSKAVMAPIRHAPGGLVGVAKSAIMSGTYEQ
jgi:hypothetical protein